MDFKFEIANPEYQYTIKTSKEASKGFILGPVNVGDRVTLIQTTILTSFDNDIFTRFFNPFIEEYVQPWLDKENKAISDIKSCLIIIRATPIAEIYINFCAIVSNGHFFIDTQQMPIRHQDEKSTMFGRAFTRSDLQLLSLNPGDNWILIATRGEIKGLYFDFSSTIASKPFDPLIGLWFKEIISHLEFLRSYPSNPELKRKIFKSGWFPFFKIRGNQFNGILNEIQCGHPISGLEKKIVNSFNDEEIRNIKDSWMKNEVFFHHKSLFDEGIDAYLAGKYICAIHILYPRIEGIMRFIYRGNNKGQPKIDDVLQDLINLTKEKKVGLSIQFPDDFKTYIKSFYLQGFDVKKNRLNLSRQSLAHGTTKIEEFTKIRAFQAILILDHISSYISTSLLK